MQQKEWKLTSRIPKILGIKYPIVQATMNWMTDAKLAAAVSNAGGLGMLGGHAGQTTNPSSTEEVIERMRTEIRKVKALTDKPFRRSCYCFGKSASNAFNDRIIIGRRSSGCLH